MHLTLDRVGGRRRPVVHVPGRSAWRPGGDRTHRRHPLVRTVPIWRAPSDEQAVRRAPGLAIVAQSVTWSVAVAMEHGRAAAGPPVVGFLTASEARRVGEPFRILRRLPIPDLQREILSDGRFVSLVDFCWTRADGGEFAAVSPPLSTGAVDRKVIFGKGSGDAC